MKSALRFVAAAMVAAGNLWMGATPAPAQTGPGYALSFNRGLNQSVRVANFGNVAPTTEVTIEFWQKVDTSPQQQTTFAMNTPGNGMNGYVPWTDGNVYWNFGSNTVSYFPPANIRGNWQHFAFVASQSGNYMKIFRNGVEEASQAGMTPFYRGNADLMLGYNGFWTWGGELDEFRVWNVARSGDQIRAYRYARISGAEADLAAYWRFEEGAGEIAADSTVPAENGALSNGPTWVPSGAPQPGSGVAGPVLTTLAASEVVGGSATLNASVNPGGNLAAVYFQWGTNSHYGNTTPAVSLNANAGATSVAHSLTGLAAGVAYHFRVVAANNLGLAYGADRAFGAPLLTLNGPALLTNQCQSAFVEPGVRVMDPVSTVAISAGGFHSLVLKGDGTVAGWGDNSFSQRDAPAGLSGVVAIDAGGFHNLALKADGTVVGWGDNYSGQTNVPPGLNQVVAVAAGGSHSVALKSDGTVAAWGYNFSGQTNVPAGVNGVVAIAAGDAHTLALKSDGTVTGWGNNVSGQATGVAGGASGSVAIGGQALTNVVSIAAGQGHSLALKGDGSVVGWGANNYLQISIPADVTNVVAIAAADQHSLALLANGQIRGWGYGAHGHLDTPASASNVVAIATGGLQRDGDHSLALRSDGAVIAWGDNSAGQIDAPSGVIDGREIAAGFYYNLALRSNGTVAAWGNDGGDQSRVPAGLNGVAGVAAGNYHGLALRTNGTVVGWGEDSSGKTNVPAGLGGVAQVAAGADHSVALKSDGTVVAWGDNFSGQTNVPGWLSGVVGIAAGQFHTLALRSDGSVAGWGYNNAGQTNVPGWLSGVVAIAAGGYHSLALKSDGTVAAWGNSNNGQTNVPAGLSGVVGIAAGGYHSLALKGDGTIVGWGRGFESQLDVPGALRAVKIAAGGFHSLALKGDSTIAAWGANDKGQGVSPGLGAFVGTIAVTDAPGIPSSPGIYARSYEATTTGQAASGAVIRTMVVPPGGAPGATTLPATGGSPGSATLQGSANPGELPSLAWFEWGTSSGYGAATPAQLVGSGSGWVPVSEGLSGLGAPGATLHYRLAVENCVQRTYGSDQVVVVPHYPSPGLAAPIANQFILPGQTNTIPLTLVNGSIITVYSSNPALVPNTAANLVVTGSGATRTLQVVPAAGQSGEALITVTVSDGEQTARSTFFVSVPPGEGDFNPLLITDFEHTWQQFPTQSMRFVFSDEGYGNAATTNLVLEYRPEIGDVWSDAQDVVIADLGGGNYEATVRQTNGTGFFRVRGVRLVTSSLGADGLNVDGNAGTNLLTVTFNAAVRGWVSYTVGQVGRPTTTNTVYVNGTTALIEVPVGENPEPGTMRNFTVTLTGAGAGAQIVEGQQTSFKVEDEESEWQGTFVSSNALIGFVMKMQATAGNITQGTLYSANYGLFPTNGQPVSVTYWSNWFSATALEVALPASSTTLNEPARLSVWLTASNSQAGQSVGPASVSGEASLIVRLPGVALDATNLGSFVLLKSPPRASTNQVNLYD